MCQLIFQQMLFQLLMVKYFLETELFNQGIRPAINVGLSVLELDLQHKQKQ